MNRDMTEIRVIPGAGTSLVQLGEDRAEVRGRLGEYNTFERAPGVGDTDQFESYGIVLTYDNDGCVSFVELDDTSSVVWDGVVLTDRPLGDVLGELESRGITMEFDGDSCYDSHEYSVTLFSEAPEELDEPVGSISVAPINRQ